MAVLADDPVAPRCATFGAAYGTGTVLMIDDFTRMDGNG
jgi:hypothetical protein